MTTHIKPENIPLYDVFIFVIVSLYVLHCSCVLILCPYESVTFLGFPNKISNKRIDWSQYNSNAL